MLRVAEEREGSVKTWRGGGYKGDLKLKELSRGVHKSVQPGDLPSGNLADSHEREKR